MFKKLFRKLLLCVTIFLTGCSFIHNDIGIIIDEIYVHGKQEKQLCQFHNDYYGLNFIDNCNKFKVGDIIEFRKKEF